MPINGFKMKEAFQKFVVETAAKLVDLQITISNPEAT